MINKVKKIKKKGGEGNNRLISDYEGIWGFFYDILIEEEFLEKIRK